MSNYKVRRYSAVPLYVTGWGEFSFEQIREELSPNLNRLMFYYRQHLEMDVPDMVAHAFLRLWEELMKDPEMIATSDRGDVLRWLLKRSNVYHYKKHFRRQVYIEELGKSDYKEDFLIEGYEGRHYNRHSDFSLRIDLRIDIERAVLAIAEKYADSLPHLVALYYLTTEVTLEDASALAGRGGTKRSWWLTSVVKPVREELAELLGKPKRNEDKWIDKYYSGDVAPLMEVVKHYENKGDERMVSVVKLLASGESCSLMQKRFGIALTAVHTLRRNAHLALRKAYGCSA